ncbi:MAG TPA: hypothetical protein VMW32_00100 [Bacteroidales bacterium]|nr:hypothetical protein [Bacteroidales bacterium]
MTFDNSKTIINIRIRLFAATVLFLGFIVLTYAAKLIKYPVLGLSDTAWTLIFTAAYLVVVFLPMYLSYQFIRFSDDSDKIVFRYFNAGIVGGRKNSVEISKKSFSGYKVDKKLFGLIQSITLFQRTQEGVAKYPPIYISALTREEKNKVFRALNILSRKS